MQHLVLGKGLLGQKIRVLLLRSGREVRGGPELGGEETGGFRQRIVHRHRQVTTRARVTGGRGVHVFHSRHGKQFLGDQGSDNAGTPRSGDETAAHGPTLARYFARHGVRKTRIQTPVTTTDRYKIHLCINNATTDGSCDFLGSLETKTQMTVAISYGNVALETSTLTSRGLLLHRHDLHNFVLQSGTKKEIYDLVLLDRQREQEDLLHTADLSFLYQATKLSDRYPLFFITLITTTPPTATTSATSIAITTSTTTATAKSTSSFTTFFSCVSHC
mmetsp:Transcript_1339/g.2170  ORF Transcript_1339/g.2170 Transcript_1339/m.2170 type:complete len:275 (+) Transcript_1339:519-1343(+)